MHSTFTFLLSITFCVTIVGQGFDEVTALSNIEHLVFEPNQTAGGIAVIDFNNDGFQDIYFIGGKYMDHLYMNVNGQGFEDVTIPTNIDTLANRYTMGVVAGDVDNDGFIDLIITTGPDDHSILMKNVNGSHFEDKSNEAGLAAKAWSTSPTLADTDLDGDLDLYISNYVDFNMDPFWQNITEPLKNFYYTNNGDGTFRLMPDIINETEQGCTLVSSFTDVDQDGDPDLFVLNDFGQKYTGNKLYINENNGSSFTESATSWQTNSTINSMGIAGGDVSGDGQLDYYISNIGDNIFYSSSESNSFQDNADERRINDGTGISWGSLFFDINNDSYLDLFVSKGTLSEGFFPDKNRMYVYRSETSNFIDLAAAYGLNNQNKARGAVKADFNNDGLQDLAINNIRIVEEDEGQARIYINKLEIDGGFLKIGLQGSVANKSAYGAFLELYANDVKWIREISGGSSFQSHNSPVAHFGLGDLESIDSLVIKWPGSNPQVVKSLMPNTYYHIVEGNEPTIIKSNINTSLSSRIIDNKTVQLYPNPAASTINLKFNTPLSSPNGTVLVYNHLGQLVQEDRLNYNESAYDISNLQDGIYIITVQTSREIYSGQLVVNHN